MTRNNVMSSVSAIGGEVACTEHVERKTSLDCPRFLRFRARAWSVGMTLVVTFLSGCQPDFTDETNAVESLLGVVGQVENASEEVDTRLVRQYINDVKNKCIKIQSEMTDTVGLNEAQALVEFCSLEGHLQSCLERKELIDAEVIETRNQLFNLKTDLTQKVANKDSVNRFIEAEFQYVESLDEGVERVVAELNGCFETYSELKDDIDRLLIALSEKDEE